MENTPLSKMTSQFTGRAQSNSTPPGRPADSTPTLSVPDGFTNERNYHSTPQLPSGELINMAQPSALGALN